MQDGHGVASHRARGARGGASPSPGANAQQQIARSCLTGPPSMRGLRKAREQLEQLYKNTMNVGACRQS